MNSGDTLYLLTCSDYSDYILFVMYSKILFML